MLLTITTTHVPATDLGYLLHKHPRKCQIFDISVGKAHVFYTEASEEKCTAALLLEIDPIGLARNQRGPAGEGFMLRSYVNDRPYVASSFMSVAISCEKYMNVYSGYWHWKASRWTRGYKLDQPSTFSELNSLRNNPGSVYSLNLANFALLSIPRHFFRLLSNVLVNMLLSVGRSFWHSL